jgi:hypothetical protein
MGEIKSALEKALEKAEKLGKLTPQEKKERQEAEYAPVGKALAERFLGHGYLHILRDEEQRYQGEEREIVIQAALTRLMEAIQLEDSLMTQRALEGISSLSDAGRIEEVKQEILRLCHEYQEAEQRRYREEKERVEREERELLHQLRISGSAVGEINLDTSEARKKRAQQLQASFQQELDSLKQTLLLSLEKPA